MRQNKLGRSDPAALVSALNDLYFVYFGVIS